MGEKLISNTPTDEFDALVEAYIERETKDTGELEAPLFYEVIREWIGSDAELDAASTLEVEGEIIDDQLVLNLPEDWDLSEHMRDIAILVGNRRLVVKLKIDPISPSVH